MRERVAAVKSKGGENRRRQKELLEGTRALGPLGSGEGREVGSNSLRLQCSPKRGSAKATGSGAKLPVEGVSCCTGIGPHLYLHHAQSLTGSNLWKL